MTNPNYTTDPELGNKVCAHLTKLGFETPRGDQQVNLVKADNEASLGIRHAMLALGLDMDDPSLKDTPARYAKMLCTELTRGLDYNNFPKCTTIPNGQTKSETIHHPAIPAGVTSQSAWNEYKTTTTGAYDELVIVKDNVVLSLCEHHLMPIDGFAHIAYIPKTKILGLSKFSRVVEFFSRRPQVQERLTCQIYHALNLVLDTPDIAVVISAVHYCMKARGALQHASTTQTNIMGGRFRDNGNLRREFLHAVR